MQGLIEELKRRNVFRVGVAYLALTWVVVQITDMAVPALNLPEGLKREYEVDRSDSVTHITRRKLDFAIIGMLVRERAKLGWPPAGESE